MMAYQDALSYNIFVKIHVFYMDHLPKINLKSWAILMLAVLLIGEQFKKHFYQKIYLHLINYAGAVTFFIQAV